jgi:hypothetical protein
VKGAVNLVKNYQCANIEELIELFEGRISTLSGLVETYGERHDSMRLIIHSMELNQTLLASMKDIKERIINGRKNR